MEAWLVLPLLRTTTNQSIWYPKWMRWMAKHRTFFHCKDEPSMLCHPNYAKHTIASFNCAVPSLSCQGPSILSLLLGRSGDRCSPGRGDWYRHDDDQRNRTRVILFLPYSLSFPMKSRGIGHGLSFLFLIRFLSRWRLEELDTGILWITYFSIANWSHIFIFLCLFYDGNGFCGEGYCLVVEKVMSFIFAC